MSQNSRRAFLKKGLFGLAALPFGMGALTSQAFASALPPAAEGHAHSYVKVSNVEGRYCWNCVFWRGERNANAEPAGCNFPQFSGVSVEAKGWCSVWGGPVGG